MKVYIVMYKFWEDIFVVNVFSTEQGAKDWINEQLLKSRYYIEPWDVL